MKLRAISEKKWYTGAVIACIGVAFYVLLTNLETVLAAVGAFFKDFRAILLGVVFAYIINPLAKFFYYRLFRKMKVGKARWNISVLLAFLSLLLAVLLLMATLIPKLVQSILLFSSGFDTYAKTLLVWLDSSPIRAFVDLPRLEALSQNALDSISDFVKSHSGQILNQAANSGRNILTTVIALILAIYMLLDKKRILTSVRQLIHGIFSPEVSEGFLDFLLRCDTILISFIGRSLLDSLIIGIITAVFMLVFRMQYTGLVAVFVGITNLIPNFGAAIGIIVGAFVLLLVNPMHALIFVVFGIALQTADAYIIKPKLFSDSLGVSGLVILIASIILGNQLGIIGILLAIPIAAIVSFVYGDYFLPWLQKRKTTQRKSSAG